HAQGGFASADASARLYTHRATHGVPHQPNIRFGRSPRRETRGGFYKPCPGGLRQTAGQPLLSITELTCLQNDLYRDSPRLLDHGPTIPLRLAAVARAQQVAVKDHVDFPGSGLDGLPRLVSLFRRALPAARKTDHRDRKHRRSVEPGNDPPKPL